MRKHTDDQAVKMNGTFCIQHLTLLLLGHPQLTTERRQPSSGKILSEIQRMMLDCASHVWQSSTAAQQ
jgi:hypothetical protein